MILLMQLDSAIGQFSKIALKINDISDLVSLFPKVCDIALDRRRGPVFVDIYSKLFQTEVGDIENESDTRIHNHTDITDIINENFRNSKKTVILVGDGIR